MVYFIQHITTKHIKIGCSERLKNRLSELQVGNSEKLRIVATCEGSYEEEKQLHKEFKEYKLRGEWFYPGQKLIFYIETYSKPFYITPEKNAIKKLRLSKYKTQTDIAEQLGITKQAINQVENRFIDESISIKTLKKYLEAIGYELKLEFIDIKPYVSKIE